MQSLYNGRQEVDGRNSKPQGAIAPINVTPQGTQ